MYMYIMIVIKKQQSHLVLTSRFNALNILYIYIISRLKTDKEDVPRQLAQLCSGRFS
jgi:hypothetical protein